MSHQLFMFCYLESDFRFVLLYALYPRFKDPNKPSAHIEGATEKGDVTYQANKGISYDGDFFVYGSYYFDFVSVHILKMI